MKVFISWSGNTSLKVAQNLRDWLPYVINSIKPYVSSEDIDKGARWSTDIAKELADSTFGILCVTKDNLEAPWLSFEAGALSKTIEKSFVTPFLFNIKRSEVQGPILQFQSTIFEKDDVKKMVKTLNKACGEGGIEEARLDKSFDVWYPTLEESLNALKKNVETVEKEDKKASVKTTHSTEMLEEILELSRGNQRLLSSPDTKLIDELVAVKDLLISIEASYENRQNSRRIKKLSPVYFDEVISNRLMHGKNSAYGFLMVLSLVKDDYPWIYDMGKALTDVLKSDISSEEKAMACSDFREIVDFTFNHPMMRDLMRNSSVYNPYLARELPFIISKILDEMVENY